MAAILFNFKVIIHIYRYMIKLKDLIFELLENVPQKGKSGGDAKKWKSDAKVIKKDMTLDEILNNIEGVPYYKEVVDDYDPETDVHSFYYKKQDVAEGKLNEIRDQLWTWVQSKFPRTQWPEYVQRDFYMPKQKEIKIEKI